MPTATDTTPAVDVRGVSFSYPPPPGERDPVVALRGITLRVARGERLGVLGPNGGGKSTLVRLILGLLTPGEGAVSVFGTDPAAARLARRVGYVPQRSGAELGFPVSVRGAVEMAAAVGLKPWRRLGRDARDRVARALELTGAADLADRPVGRLSGGQLQRVLIARALAPGPDLLLLDEPTVGIDIVGQQRFAELITRLHRELALAIVTVSHDLRAVAAASDRVACLRGSLHYHDAPNGLTPRVLAELFQHDVEAVLGPGERAEVAPADGRRDHPAPDAPAHAGDARDGAGRAHH